MAICRGPKSGSIMVGTDLNTDSVDSVLILVDRTLDNPAKSGIYEERLDTIKSEISQGLGLGRPNYPNLNYQMEYRSLMEGLETPLGKECIYNPNILTLEQEKGCINKPSTLQPVDVKGLIETWGDSTNDNPYCNTLREDFFHKYLEYFDVGNPQTEEDL